MSERRPRPADRPPQAPGSRSCPGVARRTRARADARPWPALGLATAALALLCSLPAVAGPPVSAESPAPAGAWQRAQRGPVSALALIRGRNASQAKGENERPAQAPPQTGFVPDRGGLAWQLDGGARITVRRQHGKPMLFFRREF